MQLPHHPIHRSSSSVSSHQRPPEMEFCHHEHFFKTRSSWINCALRDDEAVYWVSKGHYEAVAVGNWWYWVSRGHSCLYILQKVEIWTGVTHASLTHSQSKDSATQLLTKYKNGALVTQFVLTSHVTAKIYLWIAPFSKTSPHGKRRQFVAKIAAYETTTIWCSQNHVRPVLFSS